MMNRNYRVLLALAAIATIILLIAVIRIQQDQINAAKVEAANWELAYKLAQ